MTLNITEAELHEWAKMRADDAGRLARELVAFRLQSQAAVAAAYEAAARVVDPSSPAESCTCQACNERKWCAQSIRALATPDQIAALAAKVDASQAPNPAVNGGRCQSDTIALPRAEVEALMEAARAAWDEACANHEKAPPIKYLAPYGGLVRVIKALATLQERMK